MSKTIEGVPDFLTLDQYLGLFSALGVDPQHVVELRAAHDGIHVLVFALDANGKRALDLQNGRGAYQKHRIFIPVRREATDERTTRVNTVQP